MNAVFNVPADMLDCTSPTRNFKYKCHQSIGPLRSTDEPNAESGNTCAEVTMLILACSLNKHRNPTLPSKPLLAPKSRSSAKSSLTLNIHSAGVRESKLWEGTGLTSEGATCKKFLPNYWECTGLLYKKNVLLHIHLLKALGFIACATFQWCVESLCSSLYPVLLFHVLYVPSFLFHLPLAVQALASFSPSTYIISASFPLPSFLLHSNFQNYFFLDNSKLQTDTYAHFCRIYFSCTGRLMCLDYFCWPTGLSAAPVIHPSRNVRALPDCHTCLCFPYEILIYYIRFWYYWIYLDVLKTCCYALSYNMMSRWELFLYSVLIISWGYKILNRFHLA